MQFNKYFRFEDAKRIVPYLHALGITDIYASPYFKAKEGSLHGYDIVDPNTLNPEIGTEEEYNAFVAELQRHGMGQILDIVSNHMCIESKENCHTIPKLIVKKSLSVNVRKTQGCAFTQFS